jgi:hypothetical protein
MLSPFPRLVQIDIRAPSSKREKWADYLRTVASKCNSLELMSVTVTKAEKYMVWCKGSKNEISRITECDLDGPTGF